MAVRLVVSITAASGKGSELAQTFRAPMSEGLRLGTGEREDYEYRRTR
jgi:hypothetical protein